MKKNYAIIDTNVLISSLIKWQSNPGKIIEYISEKLITPVLNKEILEEYKEVCLRKKFGFNKRLVKKIIKEIGQKAIFLNQTKTFEEFKDKDDIVFYEVTLTAKEKFDDSYLITGNLKHFPKKPFVVTPSEMIEILEKE